MEQLVALLRHDVLSHLQRHHLAGAPIVDSLFVSEPRVPGGPYLSLKLSYLKVGGDAQFIPGGLISGSVDWLCLQNGGGLFPREPMVYRPFTERIGIIGDDHSDFSCPDTLD